MAEAKEKLDFLKLPLEEQAKYDHKKDNESSFKSVMDTARMEGEFKGKAEGKAEGRVEGIKELAALLEQGYSLPEAKKKLGLE